MVYRKNKKYKDSIEISKNLEFYKDAIDTALESGKEELVDELLRFFTKEGDKESFAACLYTCYEFVKPDVAMELAWRFGMMESYMIQTVKDLTKRMDHMQMKVDIKEEKDKKEKEQKGDQALNVDKFMNSNSLMVYQGGMSGQSPQMGGMEMNNMNMGGMNNMGMGGFQ